MLNVQLPKQEMSNDRRNEFSAIWGAIAFSNDMKPFVCKSKLKKT